MNRFINDITFHFTCFRVRLSFTNNIITIQFIPYKTQILVNKQKQIHALIYYRNTKTRFLAVEACNCVLKFTPYSIQICSVFHKYFHLSQNKTRQQKKKKM